MHQQYRDATLRELRDQQVRFAPRTKKLQQLERAEKLLSELEVSRQYPYDYLCFRITDYRPERATRHVIQGVDARHDLRLLVEDLSDAADVRVEEASEPVHTVEDLSRLFKVSTKTINRWRESGLVSRRFLFGGRKRVGFLQSTVDRFVAGNREQVRRGERFSQLSDEERGEIIARARDLALQGLTLSEVTRRLGKQMNRSPETIRYTLKNFDKQHPDVAIFPDHRGPLTAEEKRAIYNLSRRGLSTAQLARRYGRSVASIQRILLEMRAQRIFELPLDCIYNPDFDRPSLEAEILGPLPMSDASARRVRVPSGLPPYLASLYDVVLLTREQEYHLFRRMNYLKHTASKLRATLDPKAPKPSVMDQIESLYEQAVATKNDIVKANLRLVVSIAKRHVNSTDDFFSLISDGNMSLIRAVEKFDYSRGNKFSTYASWAIMKNFARTIPDEFKHRDRFRTSGEEVFMAQEDERSDPLAVESQHRQRQRQVNRILNRLDEREQRIIAARFGLGRTGDSLTLKEVGQELGVTKERIRQLEARALDKLRAAASEEKIELE
jgi:RNA polymerase primary sigma factor/RNA polymerase sigma factor